MTIVKSSYVTSRPTILQRLKRGALGNIGRFRKNEDGVAALEFALIAPVMLIIYCGLVEVLLLVEADRNVTQAASVVGDLISQNAILSLSDQTDYINAALSILDTDAETSSTNVGIEVISYEATVGAGDVREINKVGYAVFGQGYDSGEQVTRVENTSGFWTVEDTTFDATEISDSLFPTGSGIVVARVSYTYTSPLNYFVNSPTLRETFYFKPRRSATVPFDNGSDNADEDIETMYCQISTDTDTDITQAECQAIYSPGS